MVHWVIHVDVRHTAGANAGTLEVDGLGTGTYRGLAGRRANKVDR